MINGILPSAPVEPAAPAATLNPCPSDPSTINDQPSTLVPSATLNSQPSTLNSPSSPSFPLLPGETPRAFAAFMAFFQLGQSRSLPATASQLHEKLPTVNKWSSKYRWRERINSYNSGLLEERAQAEAEASRKETADWIRRSNAYREQEWTTAQKLLAAAQCFLESYGDREVAHMSLGQVSRTVQIAAGLARQNLAGAIGPQEPPVSPLHLELRAALERAYGQPSSTPAQPPASLSPQPSTLNSL